MGRFQYGIEAGLAEIFKEAQSGLGSFLFEEAWSRTPTRVQQALMILGILGGPEIDDDLVRRVASGSGVSLEDLLTAVERSHLGNRRLIGSSGSVILGETAGKFLVGKHAALSEEAKREVESSCNDVRRAYEQVQRARLTNVKDRAADAFRTEEARAAYLANLRGELGEATTWFEEAIRRDSGNVALLDRFAWFLLMRAKRSSTCGKGGSRGVRG